MAGSDWINRQGSEHGWLRLLDRGVCQAPLFLDPILTGRYNPVRLLKAYRPTTSRALLELERTSSTREQIIETARSLLERQDYRAAALNEIVWESSAPKGSLYHCIPKGKEEIAAEAIERAGRIFARLARIIAAEQECSP
jgi:hypothetical protein